MANGQECPLTNTKINRLFRSLRAKCATFAAAAASAQKRSAILTYSNACYQVTGRIAEAATPPLTVLPRPENIVFLHKSDAENVQLSKRTYEVCDTFKNVLQAAFGSLKDFEARRPPRILSLAAMCASVVGDELEFHIQTVQEETEHDDSDDTAAMQALENIYDSIPLHQRSHAIVSHALSIILEKCPSNHTLLSVLLDTTLAYDLQAQSTLLLRAIFALSFRPSPSANNYLLCHPIHFDYLLNLHRTCCRSPATSARFGLTDRAFTNIFVKTLMDTSRGRMELWTCKAVTRFAREIARSDFLAFMQLCGALVSHTAHLETSPTFKKRPKHRHVVPDKELAPDDRMHDQLMGWLREVISHLINIPVPAAEDFYAVMAFLGHTASLGFHQTRYPGLADTILCIATLCLQSPFYPNLSSDEKEILKNILRQTALRTESYDALVTAALTSPKVFRSRHEEGKLALDVLMCSATIETIRGICRPLRANSLLRLEASLWAATLRNVEAAYFLPGLATRGSIKDMDLLRRELVELVERAERRCFGPGRTQGRTGVNTPNHRAAPRETADDSSEWEWEEMVGTWIRKTPRKAPAVNPESSKKRKSREESDADHPNVTPRRKDRVRARTQYSTGRPMDPIDFGHNERIQSARTSLSGYFSSSRTHSTSSLTLSSKKTSRKRASLGSQDTSRKRKSLPAKVDDVKRPQKPAKPKHVLHESKLANSLKNVVSLHPHLLYRLPKPPVARRSDFSNNSPKIVERLHPHFSCSTAKTARSRSSDLVLEEDSDIARPRLARSSTRTELEEDDFDAPAPGVASADQLSSDDILDLFAYSSEI